MAVVQSRPGRKPSIVQQAWALHDKTARAEKKAAKQEAAPSAPAAKKPTKRKEKR
jgi:hypothetical protein